MINKYKQEIRAKAQEWKSQNIKIVKREQKERTERLKPEPRKENKREEKGRKVYGH